MLTITRTASADRDLDSIWLHIARDSIDSANNVFDAIEKKLDLLRIFPDSGANCPDLGENIRRLISGNYLIYYHHHDDTAVILRVLDGRRKIEPQMFSR